MEGEMKAEKMMQQMKALMQKHSFGSTESKKSSPEEQIASGKSWTDNRIRWCHDPEINPKALKAFKMAIKQYQRALPGCMRLE